MRLIKSDKLWNDPFADLDFFLNRAFESPFGSLISNYAEESQRGFRMDTFSDDDNYYVVAELPGFDKKQVNLELENAVLTVNAERQSGKDDNARTYAYTRSVTVGDDVDQAKVKAKLENGLLTVTLPKAEARKPRSIAIK